MDTKCNTTIDGKPVGSFDSIKEDSFVDRLKTVIKTVEGDILFFQKETEKCQRTAEWNKKKAEESKIELKDLKEKLQNALVEEAKNTPGTEPWAYAQGVAGKKVRKKTWKKGHFLVFKDDKWFSESGIHVVGLSSSCLVGYNDWEIYEEVDLSKVEGTEAWAYVQGVAGKDVRKKYWHKQDRVRYVGGKWYFENDIVASFSCPVKESTNLDPCWEIYKEEAPKTNTFDRLVSEIQKLMKDLEAKGFSKNILDDGFLKSGVVYTDGFKYPKFPKYYWSGRTIKMKDPLSCNDSPKSVAPKMPELGDKVSVKRGQGWESKEVETVGNYTVGAERTDFFKVKGDRVSFLLTEHGTTWAWEVGPK